MNTTKVVHVQRTINRQLAPSYSCKDMKLPVWATEIGPEAFSENRKIETIYFPHSLKYIRHHAFRHCLHLKRIILPDGLLELGEGAFAECSDLFAAVLPASLRVLPRALFVGDMALKNVTFAENSNLERIEPLAFHKCRHLSSITLPDTLAEIGDRAFYDCKRLNAFHLPSGLKKVGTQAFYFCPLTDQPFPESLEFIAEAAFFRCAFTSVVLPRSVTYIGAMLSTEATRSNIWNFTMTRILSARILRIRLRSSVAMRDQRWIRTVRSMDIRRNICK